MGDCHDNGLTTKAAIQDAGWETREFIDVSHAMKALETILAQ
jgi:hypothetical protein